MTAGLAIELAPEDWCTSRETAAMCTTSSDQFVQRACFTPPVLLQSLAGQGSQHRRLFVETARPCFLIVQSFHDLGCDGVLFLSREGLNTPQCFLEKASHLPMIAQALLPAALSISQALAAPSECVTWATTKIRHSRCTAS